MRLAVAIRDGKPDPTLDSVEVIWSDPKTRTVAQVSDAALKLVAAQVLPPDSALELIGYTPTQIARVREMRVSTPVPVLAGTATEGDQQ